MVKSSWISYVIQCISEYHLAANFSRGEDLPPFQGLQVKDGDDRPLAALSDSQVPFVGSHRNAVNSTTICTACHANANSVATLAGALLALVPALSITLPPPSV